MIWIGLDMITYSRIGQDWIQARILVERIGQFRTGQDKIGFEQTGLDRIAYCRIHEKRIGWDSIG